MSEPTIEQVKIERDFYIAKSDILWGALVMLKRELDPHETKPGFLELPESAWDTVVARCAPYNLTPPR